MKNIINSIAFAIVAVAFIPYSLGMYKVSEKFCNVSEKLIAKI